MNKTACEKCGQEYAVGEWPYCPHGVPLEYRPFVPYFDVGLGKHITSQAERWARMKECKADYKSWSPRGVSEV